MKSQRPGAVSLYVRLLGWRLRFYADATLKLLLRRWQLWVFVLFAASPADTPLAAQIHAVGSPVRHIVEGGDAIYSAAAWLAMSVVALAWSAVQAEALRGGAAWRHLRTLPGVGRLEVLLDHGVLLIADLPLLLPVAAYLASLPASAADGLVAAGLALQWPVLQQLTLRRSLAGTWVFAASLAAVLALCREEGRFAAPALLAAGPMAGYLLLNPRKPAAAPKTASWWPGQRLSGSRSPFMNLTTINLLALTQWNQLPSRLALAAYAAVLTWFGEAWESLGLRQPAAAGLLIAGILPLLFQVAGLAVILRNGRHPMLPWLASMGIGDRLLRTSDLAVLESAFALLALGPLWMLQRCVETPRTWLILPLGGFALTLLVLLYGKTASTRFVPKLAVAFGFLATGWWAVLA